MRVRLRPPSRASEWLLSAPVTLERKSGWCAEAVGGVLANWLADAGLGGSARGWMFINRATDSKSVGWPLTNASSRNMAMAEIRVTSGWVKEKDGCGGACASRAAMPSRKPCGSGFRRGQARS